MHHGPAHSPQVGAPARWGDRNGDTSLWLGYGWLPVKHAERPVAGRGPQGADVPRVARCLRRTRDLLFRIGRLAEIQKKVAYLRLLKARHRAFRHHRIGADFRGFDFRAGNSGYRRQGFESHLIRVFSSDHPRQRNIFTFYAPPSSVKRMYSPSLRVMAHAAPAQSAGEQLAASDVEAQLRINFPALQQPAGHGRTR